MSDYDEDDQERIAHLKSEMTVALIRRGVQALPFEIEGDIYVEGPLSVIAEFCQDWRSEIEELG